VSWPFASELERYTAHNDSINPAMNDIQHSETPDASIVSFNSNYEAAEAISQSSNPENFSRSLDEVVNEMSAEIWRVCYFLLDASPKKEILSEQLMRVFKTGETLYLDSWGPVNIKVLPPTKARNALGRQLGNTAVFQFGYLILEADGNAKVETEDGEETIVSRLTGLFGMLDTSE